MRLLRFQFRSVARLRAPPNAGDSKIVPRFVPRSEKMSIESRKDSKAAKRALHVCARVIVPATRMNPEQRT